MSEDIHNKAPMTGALGPGASGPGTSPPVVRGEPAALVSVSGSPSQLDLHVRAGNHGEDVQVGTLTVSIRQPDGSVLQERFIRAGLIRAANALGGVDEELPMASTMDVVMLDGGSGDLGLSDFAGDDQLITIDVSSDELPSFLRERRAALGLEGPADAPADPHAPFDASAWDDEHTEIARPNAMPLDWQTDSWPNGTDLRTAHARYVLVGTLGISNLSESHLAYEILPEVLPRAVAVERLLASPDVNWSARRARYVRRARIGSRLRHPNLVQVIAQGELRGIPFLVHEVIDGLNLRSLAAFAEGGVPATVICEIGRQVSEALTYIYAATDESGEALNLVHGEISPATISVGRDGRVQLSEPGCSRMSELVYEGCASPEQARGGAIDPRADFFALGVTLVELLSASSLAPTGKLNFPSLSAEIDARLSARADLPRPLVALLLSMTAIEPEHRPAHVGTVLAVFEELVKGLGGRGALQGELAEVFSRATPSSPSLPAAMSSRPSRPASVASSRPSAPASAASSRPSRPASVASSRPSRPASAVSSRPSVPASAASSRPSPPAMPLVAGTPVSGPTAPASGEVWSEAPAPSTGAARAGGSGLAPPAGDALRSRPVSVSGLERRVVRESRNEPTPVHHAAAVSRSGGHRPAGASGGGSAPGAPARSILDDHDDETRLSPGPSPRLPGGWGLLALGLLLAIGLGALLSWISS